MKGRFFLWMHREMLSFLLGFLRMESLSKGWSLCTNACQMPQSLEYFLPSQNFTEVMEFTGCVRKTRTCLHRRSFSFFIITWIISAKGRTEKKCGEETESALCWLALGRELGHGCHWKACGLLNSALLCSRLFSPAHLSYLN